jgi:hypothetical protein
MSAAEARTAPDPPSPPHPSFAGQADRYLEDHHEAFEGLGRSLLAAFPPAKDRISTQVRNLQQVVTTATRFVDVEDFVKNQMGKDRSRDKPWHRAGPEILKQLETLRQEPAKTPGIPTDESAGSAEQLDYRLRLARGWVRAVVAEYLYRYAIGTTEDAGG